MSRLACVVSLLWLAALGAPARHAHHYYSPDGTTLTVGGLQFTIPGSWQPQPPETAARAGQWNVASTAERLAEPVQVVVFFFGPGVGGTVKENIDAWTSVMTAPDGTAVPAPQKRSAGGHPVTEVLLTGTYTEATPQPGLPPTPRPGYALWGAVLENPGGGSLYWRATGPAAQVATLAPVLDQILDSVRPQPAAPAPPP